MWLVIGSKFFIFVPHLGLASSHNRWLTTKIQIELKNRLLPLNERKLIYLHIGF